MPRKSGKHCVRQEHWTAVAILLGLISIVYSDLSHWKSDQRPQNTEPKLNHWAIGPPPAQALPN